MTDEVTVTPKLNLERIQRQIETWDGEEPRDDWWHWQRDFAAMFFHLTRTTTALPYGVVEAFFEERLAALSLLAKDKDHPDHEMRKFALGAVVAVKEDLLTAAKQDSDAELLRERVAELEAELKKARSAHWFYYGNDCESEKCRFDIGECISEDFEWDNKPEGDHVLLISGARPVPDMWVALHYLTEAEKDERDSDDSYTFTVHDSKEAAQAYLDTRLSGDPA